MKAGGALLGRKTGLGGSGSTGPNEGRGSGPRDGGAPEDVKFDPKRLRPNELNPGQMIGSLPTDEPAPKGDVQVPVRMETREALQRMAEKVDTEVLPAEYREQVLRYMELLRRPAGTGTSSVGEGAEGGGASGSPGAPGDGGKKEAEAR